MRFPNAFGGVKKIWLSEILALIAGCCVLVTTIVSIAGAAAGSETVAGVGLLGTGVAAIIAMILAIISFIIQLVGLNQAGKDEAAFKKGFYFALIGIAVSIIGSFFANNNQTLYTVFQVLQTICSVLTFVFGIQGIQNLAKQYNNQEMVDKGNNILKITVGVYAVSIVATLIAMIAASAAATVAGILSLVASVASLVAYILYLMYLTKAKAMLAA